MSFSPSRWRETDSHAVRAAISGDGMATILVIDDDLGLRRSLCELLESEGHRTDSAGDGREGLERFGERPADLVVTDLMMPKADGLEVIRSLRRRFPGLLIVAITGENSASHRLWEARRLGVDMTLRKPFHPAQLTQAVRLLLEGDQAERPR